MILYVLYGLDISGDARISCEDRLARSIRYDQSVNSVGSKVRETVKSGNSTSNTSRECQDS
jgi:hypothetical protein